MAAATVNRKVGMDLTQGPIMKGLVAFSAPIVLAALIQQLYSVVDLIIIGQFMGNAGTIGVSTGGEWSDMVTPVATAFANAGQIYIAQLIGARRRDGVKSAVNSLMSLMILMSVVFMVIGLAGHRVILDLLNCPSDGYRQAVNYLLITSAGIPFIFGYNAVCGVLRGMGESRAPMVFIIIAALVNIVLDYALVAWFRMEAAGTAIATVLSQFASFAASYIYMLRHKEQFDYRLSLSSFRMNRGDVKVICSLGVPQAIRSSLVRISMFWVNSQVNAFGADISSLNGIGNKLQKFLDIFSSSFQQAAAAMIGQNLGAGRKDRASQVVWHTMGICMGISVVIVLLTISFPQFTFGVFTQEAGVLALAEMYLKIFSAHFICSAMIAAFQAMVIGSGNASLNFAVGILDGIVCKIGLSLLFANVMNMGYRGFFLGTAWSRAIPTLVCFAYFISGRWKNRRLLVDQKK